MRLVILVFAVAAAGRVYGATCTAQSPAATAAVVELYTSESCAACPDAERWLASFRQAHGGEGFLPVVLRFDTGDYLYKGSDRPQRKLTVRQRIALLHSPRVLLQGRELLRRPDDGQLDGAVRRINSGRARARIGLEVSPAGENALRIGASASLLEPRDEADAVLYLAAYEERPEGYLVLEWEGPFPFAEGRVQLAGRPLALLPGARPADSGAIGLVQNRRSGEILQALAISAC